MKFVTCVLAVTLEMLSQHRDSGVMGFLVTPSPSVASHYSQHERMACRSGVPPAAERATAAAVSLAALARPSVRVHRTIMNAAEDGATAFPGEGNSSDGGDKSGDDNGVGNDGGSGAVEKGDEGEKSLAGLVEQAFVMAAAANSYQQGIKTFIGVIKEAYERGYTVPALTMEVSFVPTKTAGRDLYAEEVELRSIWIALIYLTLEKASWPQKVQRAHEISAPFMDRFSEFVSNVMEASSRGHTLQTLKMEEVMRRGAEPRTPMEAAVLSQSMRIVFATLDLMKEGWTG